MNLHIEFYLLNLCVCCFFIGWFAKIAIEQYKADQKRKQEAEMRRVAYMKQKAKQRKLEEKHRLWDSNMKETADVFSEGKEDIDKEYAAMGGTKADCELCTEGK